MKRLILIILTVLVFPGLTACSMDTNHNAAETTMESENISIPTTDDEVSSSSTDTTALGLSDYDLYETTYLETVDLVYSYPSESIALANFTPERRIFYIASIYDMEIQNGGLCQFFVNHPHSLAPYVEEALTSIGAESHHLLFSEFIADNKIDVHDLDSFVINDISEYAAQTERYDFNTFDDRYYKLTPLYEYMAEYIRQNADAF